MDRNPRFTLGQAWAYISSIPFHLRPPLIMVSSSPVDADEEKKNVEHSAPAIHDENPVMNEKADSNEEIPDDIATVRKKRRLLWKIDLFILPLLVMVSIRDVQTWEMQRLLEWTMNSSFLLKTTRMLRARSSLVIFSSNSQTLCCCARLAHQTNSQLR